MSKRDLPTRTLGQYIRSVRTTWGWSQQQLADALKCDQAAVSFWENCHVTPGGTSLVALACLFGLTVERLQDEHNLAIPVVPYLSIPAFRHLPRVEPPPVQVDPPVAEVG